MVGSDLWWELTYATADLFAKKMKKISASQGESAKESHFSAGEGKNRRHFFFPETTIFFFPFPGDRSFDPSEGREGKKGRGPEGPPLFSFSSPGGAPLPLRPWLSAVEGRGTYAVPKFFGTLLKAARVR